MIRNIEQKGTEDLKEIRKEASVKYCMTANEEMLKVVDQINEELNKREGK